MSDQLLSLFAPHYCINCSKSGEHICGTCRLDFVQTNPSVCYRCNKLSEGNQTCVPCRSSSPIFSVDWAADYGSAAKTLVARGKFGSSRGAIRAMAMIMHQELPLRGGIDLVTYVPTATKRVRQRGFDHAKLLAKQFARLRGIPCRRLLHRRTQAKQMGASRLTRRRQLKTAFRPASVVHAPTVLLIDDVVSTGASLEACARTLKKAGAKRIHAAVFARNRG